MIKLDRIIRDMLLVLGARVTAISEPFFPEHGACREHGGHNHAAVNR